MIAVCSIKKNDVIECVKAIGNGSCEVIMQTTNRRYTELNNKTQDVPGFSKRHAAKHIVDMDAKTLHTMKCKKAGKRVVKARIINKIATGLVVCKCCKK